VPDWSEITCRFPPKSPAAFDRNQVPVCSDFCNPLQDLIAFMQRQLTRNRTYRNVYEMTIYDPTRDAGKPSNRQCLSFLSFKLTADRRLLLTAIYRNHTYISRGLGNFIGLGRLQAFVAEQSGATLGSLTCVSTHAQIDTDGWSKAEAGELIQSCQQLVQ
jgi:thymidylate synthase